MLHQVLCKRLETQSALLKIKSHKSGKTLASGVFDGLGKVNAFGMGVGDGLAIDSAAQRRCGLGALPASANVTLNRLGHGVFIKGKY